jgi:hypothetical protein
MLLYNAALARRPKPTVTPDWSHTMVIPGIGGTTRVCLQSWMGTFVCAEGGGGGLVVVNRPEAAAWETFELSRSDEAHVTLKAANGQYVCAEGGGGSFVVANRSEAGDWEKFGAFVDANGLVLLTAHNGEFLRADTSGALLANLVTAQEPAAFRIVRPAAAAQTQTRIEVNVYKIMLAPFWHTGTVIGDREYYFDMSNQVLRCWPRDMPGHLKHHRTMARFVPSDMQQVKSKLDIVMDRWNGTRYDVAGHNCNFFTDDLLHSLGVPGLDQEYLNASGLAKGLRQIPGGATAQELLKFPPTDWRLDKAFMEDLRRLKNLPDDTKRELERLGGAVAEEWKKIRPPW